MKTDPICRPPVGFVVEGRAEHNCYPSLVHRSLGLQRCHVPCLNAGGYGNIIRHLDEQLTDLVLTFRPFTVIVTIDLFEVLSEGICRDCGHLCQELQASVERWFAAAETDRRLKLLPEAVTVVIQIQKFESWIASDIEALNGTEYLRASAQQVSSVDTSIDHPHNWLQSRLALGINIKNPRHAKSLVSRLRIDEMRKNSSSFDKFVREVTAAYAKWLEHCQAQGFEQA